MEKPTERDTVVKQGNTTVTLTGEYIFVVSKIEVSTMKARAGQDITLQLDRRTGQTVGVTVSGTPSELVGDGSDPY